MLHVIRMLAGTILFSIAGCTVTHTSATSEPAKQTIVKTVLTQPLPPNLGSEARVLVVEYPPGATSAAHRHPGAVFVYVIEGAVECGLDDGPVTRYEQGQSWYEKPGQLHRVAKNASQTQPAKLVVFFLTDPGKPVLEREK